MALEIDNTLVEVDSPIEFGSLIFQAGGGTHILSMHPNGTIEIGSGFTPTEAAKEFLDVLAIVYPNYVCKPTAS